MTVQVFISRIPLLKVVPLVSRELSQKPSVNGLAHRISDDDFSDPETAGTGSKVDREIRASVRSLQTQKERLSAFASASPPTNRNPPLAG